MTEKDFRKLIASLEVSKEEKENYLKELTEDIKAFIPDYSKAHFKELNFGGNLADGTFFKESSHLEFNLSFDFKEDENFLIINQIILNEWWNAIVLFYGIEKYSDIYIDEKANAIIFKKGDLEYQLNIRYLGLLQYQNQYLDSEEKLKLRFANYANEEYNLFKNTLQLIKYFKEVNKIEKLSDYELNLILYNGLSKGLNPATYEDYFKEFCRSLDDLLKGLKLDFDPNMLTRLGLEKVAITTRGAAIIDPITKTNLLSKEGESYLNEAKKLKRVIQKALQE